MNNNTKPFELSCIALSEGIGIGKAFIYRDILKNDISFYKISKNDIPYELRRIKRAMNDVTKELFSLERQISQDISSEQGKIFNAQKTILDDPVLMPEFEAGLQDNLINAEQVLRNVFRKYISKFSDSTHERLQAKADDLRDIVRKILRSLLGIDKSALEKLPRNAIVVARRLLPSDTASLDKVNISGIVVQEGSVHSHSALLARSLKIPAVWAKELVLDKVLKGTGMIINGTEGRLYYNPPIAVVKEYREKQRLIFSMHRSPEKTKIGFVRMKNGEIVKVFANASNCSEVKQAVSHGCDGIGLFRTEALYLESKLLPTENELYKKLAEALKIIGNLPVTLRVLDIGGDKRLPYLENADIDGSFLGLRGIRYLLKNPELLRKQLMVFVRLRKRFNVRILLPMISFAGEVALVREILDDCLRAQSNEKKLGRIQLGSMIETPAAVFSIKDIVKISDFISIGTNDLAQYTMAAGRENPEVADYYDKGVDHIFTMTKIVTRAARAQGKECSLCGEMANDTAHVERLVEAGIRSFSVSPYQIQKIKQFISELE
jgi:phosphotransferase system enzyme I (PtsI)